MLSIKAYQTFLLGHLARSIFWKSAWKIDSIFIFTNLHILWRFTSQKMQYIHKTWCLFSSLKEIDAFWYPRHPSMVKIGWSKNLSEKKWHSWILNNLFDFYWKLKKFCCKCKHLLWIFSHRFVWIELNIYARNNLESTDTFVTHPNAFLEYVKPLVSALTKF